MAVVPTGLRLRVQSVTDLPTLRTLRAERYAAVDGQTAPPRARYASGSRAKTAPPMRLPIDQTETSKLARWGAPVAAAKAGTRNPHRGEVSYVR